MKGKKERAKQGDGWRQSKLREYEEDGDAAETVE
jgi:hypothetical protein